MQSTNISWPPPPQRQGDFSQDTVPSQLKLYLCIRFLLITPPLKYAPHIIWSLTQEAFTQYKFASNKSQLQNRKNTCHKLQSLGILNSHALLAVFKILIDPRTERTLSMLKIDV